MQRFLIWMMGICFLCPTVTFYSFYMAVGWKSLTYRATTLSGDPVDDAIVLATEYAEDGRLDAARRTLLKVIEQHPESDSPWFTLGNVCEDAGRLKEAAHAYNMAVQKGDDGAKLNLGRVNSRILGEPDDGFRYFSTETRKLGLGYMRTHPNPGAMLYGNIATLSKHPQSRFLLLAHYSLSVMVWSMLVGSLTFWTHRRRAKSDIENVSPPASRNSSGENR